MNAKKPVVLVVDDEVNIRKTVVRALNKLDCDVRSAVNGEEAMDMVGEEAPDVMLLDMKMPGMDGLEVLRQLREGGYSTHVIMITAYGTVDNAVEAMKLGAVDFLQKPFLPDEIRDLVQDMLERPDPASLRPREDDYDALVDAALAALKVADYARAEGWLRQAGATDDLRPEAHNLLGALYELRGDRRHALKMYRVALSIEPGYNPSRRNLDRLTSLRGGAGPIDLGEPEEE